MQRQLIRIPDSQHGATASSSGSTHSDHINGLSAKSFGYKVYCSEDAKEMPLRHEVYAERELQALELRSEKIRTYSHLRVDPLLFPDGTMYYTGSRDLLVRRFYMLISKVNVITDSIAPEYANTGGSLSG